MRFRDDTRGVTVQVGAVLLFATIIIALSVYQATIVPSENADVEYRHSQQVQGQMVDVRNALVGVAETGDARPATVSLGTEYPNRVFLVNPPPPAGTLRTDTYDDPTVSVSNVNATNPETRDYLDGSWSQSTKALSYVPGYNEYRDAPQLRYDGSLLSNYYSEQNTSVPLTDQLLVNENTRTVSLVALNGSLGTSQSSSVAVSPKALSAPAERVQVQSDNSSQPVNVTIPTVVDAGVLRNSTGLGDSTDVTVVQDGPERVTLSVNWSEPFTLRTAKVGVGSDASDPDPHYLTLMEKDDDSVTVEARDAYNNPESGVPVNTTQPDVFADEDGEKLTGEDGRVTFEAEDGESDRVVLSILNNSSARERVSVEIDATTAVGNGSGGSLVYHGDGTAFDGGDDDTNPGGFNFSIGNTYASEITITDVTVLPEDHDTYGLSDESAGFDYGQAELYVNATSGDTDRTVVDAPLVAGDEYLYIGARGLTLDLTENRTEETYDSGGTMGTVTTNASGGAVALDPNDVAEVAFAEFHSDTTEVDVTDEDFRVSVAYQRNGVSESREFVVYADSAGDDDGENGSTSASQTSYVAGRGSAARAGPESRVDLDIQNTGSDAVSITQISISGSGPLSTIMENNGGSNQAGQHEVFINATTDGLLEMDGAPYYDDDGSESYQLGTVESLTETATLNPGAQAQVTLLNFRNNGGQTMSAADRELSVTLYFQDGSSTSFTFTPPGH